MNSSKVGENSQEPSRKRKPPVVSYVEVGEIRVVERVLELFYRKSVGFMLGQVKKRGDREWTDDECECYVLNFT